MRPAHSPQTRERAANLREAGLGYKEIAAYLGVGSGTVYRWLNPDHAEKQRRQSLDWKKRNAGECDTCGGPTNGSNGKGTAATRCASCVQWSPEAIILALKEWAEEHGTTPRCSDSRRGQIAHGRVPYETTVKAYFGSWNEGLAAAGLAVNRTSRARPARLCGEIPHGTVSGYANHGCRCEECGPVGRAYYRERRRAA